jgi:hypothetical protein
MAIALSYLPSWLPTKSDAFIAVLVECGFPAVVLFVPPDGVKDVSAFGLAAVLERLTANHAMRHLGDELWRQLLG